MTQVKAKQRIVAARTVPALPFPPRMRWGWTDTGRGEAAWNMAFDEAMLGAAAELKMPLLRFYGWTEAAATFGYFQRYAEIAAWTELRPLIRRPTGGGLVPHANDWTYSVAIPPSDAWYELRAVESYLRLHEWICESLRAAGVGAEIAPVASKDAPGQCFVGAERYDVLFNGRKIAGAAQRRTREGLLIQGSIQGLPAEADRALWQEKMLASINAKPFSASLIDERARALAQEKYSQASYNQRR